MARVKEVIPSRDGLVRSCIVGYGLLVETKTPKEYKGQKWVSIKCSVQCLTLLMVKEEQGESLTVDDDVIKRESEV